MQVLLYFLRESCNLSKLRKKHFREISREVRDFVRDLYARRLSTYRSGYGVMCTLTLFYNIGKLDCTSTLKSLRFLLIFHIIRFTRIVSIYADCYEV